MENIQEQAKILTEEELDHLVKDAIVLEGLRMKSVLQLINSHRQLLSANAELSFNNPIAKAKVREYYLGLKSVKGANQIGADHAMLAIENVLDAFKIKIEDVNA